MTQSPESSLVLLVPAYNEEERIGPVLRRYAEYFRENYGGRFEIVVVILVLGAFLTYAGGTVRVPVFEQTEDGGRRRVFIEHPNGEREAVFEERNKFLNGQNLTQLAKDTSFIAIMAVGATMVIISGGIDLSVGAVYALASVVAAMAFQHFGPEGSGGGGRPDVGPGRGDGGVPGGGSAVWIGERRDDRGAAGASVHHHAGDDGDFSRDRVCDYERAVGGRVSRTVSEPDPV